MNLVDVTPSPALPSGSRPTDEFHSELDELVKELATKARGAGYDPQGPVTPGQLAHAKRISSAVANMCELIWTAMQDTPDLSDALAASGFFGHLCPVLEMGENCNEGVGEAMQRSIRRMRGYSTPAPMRE